MLRILHVLPSLKQSYGGPIRAVLDLSARATRFGIRTEVLGFGELDIPDNPLGTESIHSLPVSRPRRYCYSRELVPWLNANLTHYDGVVLHGMWLYPSSAAASACVRTRTPYACFPHGMLEPWPVYKQSVWKAVKKVFYWNLREKRIFKRARCLYFTTDRERALADQTFHLGGTQRILIPYGIEMVSERISAPTTAMLTQPPSRKVALFLGRIHPKKNLHFLIQAWRQARPPEPWHLIIAGSGDEKYTARLRNLVAAGGLQETVHFTGFLSGKDKTYLLQRASWFLLPSEQENFGIAVAEAINHGCPVAISEKVSFCEFMHPQSEVLPVDLGAWVKFMRERMPDDAWRSKLIELDRATLLPKMSTDRVSQDWASTLLRTFGSVPDLVNAVLQSVGTTSGS